MNKIFNGLCALLSFTAGFLAVGMISGNIDFAPDREPRTISTSCHLTPIIYTGEDGTIAIIKSFYQEEEGVIEFTITNHSLKRAKYWAENNFLRPRLKRNGTEIELMTCGTGLIPNILESGQSITTKVSTSLFETFSKSKKDKFQGGFWLEIEGEDARPFWSESFKLNQLHSNTVVH